MSQIFEPGTVIANRFEIDSLLGRGGMGSVWGVFDRITGMPRALKTFRTDHISHAAARQIFINEMSVLLNLEEHPCIVGVRWMEEYNSVPFIVTDLIAADAFGRVTLTDHIRFCRGPMALEQILNWSIQFCHAMEFCLAHGIDAHRDVKPDNILIQQGKLVKVADFGIARAVRATWQTNNSGELQLGAPESIPLRHMEACQERGGGTPGYLSPEVCSGDAGDRRADIYAFGQILWQMGTGVCHSPFVDPTAKANDLATVYRRQLYELLPEQPTAGLASALQPVVEQCLRANPKNRYASFTVLRTTLEEIFETQTGQRLTISIPEIVPEVFWVDKGASLHALGREEEAIACYDRAMRDGPLLEALINKAVSLIALKRAKEALDYCEQALGLDKHSALAWDVKGICLESLGKYEAAAEHHHRAVDYDPHYAPAWANLAHVRLEQGRVSEALGAVEKALVYDPKLVIAMGTRARALAAFSQLDPALETFAKAIELQPYDAMLWADKGEVLRRRGNLRDAMASVERGLRLNASETRILIIKGNCLRDMGRNLDALDCFERVLASEPLFPPALFSKASVLDELDRLGAAAEVWADYIEIARKDPIYCQSEWLTYARGRLLL